MKNTFWNRVKLAAASLATVGMVLPQSTLFAADAAAPVRPAQAAVDVELGQNGTMTGRVINPQGVVVPGTAVAAYRANQLVASTTTNGEGNFVLSNLQPGTYQLATVSGGVVLRVWAEGTAPPAAQKQAVLVHNPQAVRGQIGPPVLGDHEGLLGLRPLTSLAVVAAAIAIPLGIAAADDDDAPPASP